VEVEGWVVPELGVVVEQTYLAIAKAEEAEAHGNKHF
jgi:hypothetical protein